jgi:hypothetical protein
VSACCARGLSCPLRRHLRNLWPSAAALQVLSGQRRPPACLHRAFAARGGVAPLLRGVRAARGPARGSAGAATSLWLAASPGRWSRSGRARATCARRTLLAHRARRHRTDPDSGLPRWSRHGQLVARLGRGLRARGVRAAPPERLARGGGAAVRPPPVPGAGDLLERRPCPGGRVAFHGFCAMSYEGDRPKVWKLEAFTDAHTPTWERFLHSLPGKPQRVVCDAHSGQCWPPSNGSGRRPTSTSARRSRWRAARPRRRAAVRNDAGAALEGWPRQ